MKIENLQSQFSWYAREQCEGIYEDLCELVDGPPDAFDGYLIEDSIRRLHSLAGSAGLMGKKRIALCARKAEGLLIRYESKRNTDQLVIMTCRCLRSIVRELNRRPAVCFSSRAI